MIEWIVWRVDTGVKKKLLMGAIVYVTASPNLALKPLVTGISIWGIPAAKSRGFPGLVAPLTVDSDSNYQWTLILNSIARGEPPPPSWPNVVGLERLRLGPLDWKWLGTLVTSQ